MSFFLNNKTLLICLDIKTLIRNKIVGYGKINIQKMGLITQLTIWSKKELNQKNSTKLKLKYLEQEMKI